MFRTRNFLLYVCAFVFLVSSIGYTVSQDIAAAKHTASPHVAVIAPPVALGVVAPDLGDDRSAYIARMKEKLARGEGEIPGAPVVFTSVDSTPVASSAAVPVDERTVQWCAAPNMALPAASSWEAADIEIHTAEGARIVTRGSFAVSASSTEAAIPDVVLQLPMRHVRAAGDSCILFDVVGIALDGNLIRNSDAARYQRTGASTLIGYALDGFPIYGPVAGDTNMDACGGSDTAAGYQYHIRADEPFILGCFAAPPAQFLQ